MDLIQGYKEPDFDEMSEGELIGLVHRIIHLINADRLLSEDVFNYTPAQMDRFLGLIHNAVSARRGYKSEMIELVEALYGDPSLRELYAASNDHYSQRLHKRARRGGGKKTRGRRSRFRRRR